MKNEKIAVLSDIHGNSWALAIVLADIKRRKIDLAFNLGDSLYGPLDPAGTFTLLAKNDMPAVSGNQDRIILEKSDNPTLHFVRGQLDHSSRNWLESLPFCLCRDDFFLCHGTPQSDSAYLLEKVTAAGVILKSPGAVASEIAAIDRKVILCGHSHVPRVLRLDDDRLIVNAGSVGLPAYDDDQPHFHAMENGTPHTRYVIFHKQKEHWQVDTVALAYDWEAAASCAEKNGRSDWAHWLRTGRI